MSRATMMGGVKDLTKRQSVKYQVAMVITAVWAVTPRSLVVITSVPAPTAFLQIQTSPSYWFSHIPYFSPHILRILHSSFIACAFLLSWIWQEFNNSRITYLLTYLLSYSCSRVLLEKLTGSQLVKKFPAFYGTRSFITAFTTARHLASNRNEYQKDFLGVKAAGA